MLQNIHYDAVMREYDRRQTAARHLWEQRHEEVYTRIPRLQEIDGRVGELSLEKTRALLLGEAAGTADLKQAVGELSAKRLALLQEHGYPPDYLEMPYTCKKCQDTGFIDGERCSCFYQTAAALLGGQANLGEILEKENFSHFSFRYYSDRIINKTTGLTAYETAQRAVEKAKRFLASFDTSFQNLFLYGETGVGKTFLSHCIAKELLDSGHWVVYFTAFDLFDLFARHTFHRDREASPWLDSVFESDLLIIDDLGTELTNSFVASQLFLCVNERILKQKSTIISTNLGIEEFSHTYSERIFSRIVSNYEMVKLIGQDIRKQKTLAGG